MGPALEPATCPSSPGIQLLLLPTPPGPVLRGSPTGIQWPGVACAARETASLRREIRAAPASGTFPADYQTNLEGCATANSQPRAPLTQVSIVIWGGAQSRPNYSLYTGNTNPRTPHLLPLQFLCLMVGLKDSRQHHPPPLNHHHHHHHHQF